MITVNKYFKPIKKGVEGTLTKDNVFLAITAQPGGNPINKQLKNYVRETDYFKPVKKDTEATIDNYVKERESNESDVEVELLNGTSEGIIANLDANYHKGLGPADVRKNRRRRTHIIEREHPQIVDNVYPNGHWSGSVYDTNHIAPTVMGQRSDNVVRIKEDIAVDNKYPLKIATNTSKGYDEVCPNDGIRLAHPSSSTARGRTEKEGTGALACTDSCDWGTLSSDYRIRRLTPVECERLQAFKDDWTKYGVDDEPISDTQRYKCIGNAVTTTVITHIINEMFDEVFKHDG